VPTNGVNDHGGTPWLPFGSGSADRVRLVCLPHAGAGASAYRRWAGGLPGWIAACLVQLPGRESRSEEPLCHSMTALIEGLADDLLPLLDGPYAVFGHSVGAVTAFELIRELRRRAAPPPAHLFLAGAPAPHLKGVDARERFMTVAGLASLMRRLGGTPEEFIDDLRFLNLLLPLFRADLSVRETYVCVPEPPLSMPITVFGATRDPRASEADTRAWSEHTSGPFTHYVLDGGHFAVLEQTSLVHSHIAAALRATASRREGTVFRI
jgi:surfactin synthase thioesterase subunit